MSHDNRSSVPALSAAQDIAVIRDEVIDCATYLRHIRDSVYGSYVAPEVPMLVGNETAELYFEWEMKMQNRIDTVMRNPPQKEMILYIASRTTGVAYRALARRLYPPRGSSLAVIDTGFGTVRDANDALAILHAHIQNNGGGRDSFA